MAMFTPHTASSAAPGARRFVTALLLASALPAQALQITSLSPQGDVARVRQVVAKFDEAAVNFGDPKAPAPLQLNCSDAQATQGTGRWTNEKEWVFDFSNDLPPGVRCAVQVRAGFESPKGATLAARTWAFNTGGPFVQSVRPGTYQRIDEEQFFALQLNGPATAASVQANMWCAVEGLGERVPVRLIDGAVRTALLASQGLEKAAAKDPLRYVALACARRFTPASKLQIVFGKGGDIAYSRSFKLGSLRMTRSFFPDGIVSARAVTKCRKSVRGHLAPMLHEVATLPFDVAVASSGTAEALAVMSCSLRGTPPQTMNGAVLTRSALGEVIDSLASAQTTEARRELPGIDAARADILLGGAIVIEQICDGLGIDELVISEYALREGVLLDGLHRIRGGSLHHLSDLRRASVNHLIGLCDDDPDHSYKVSTLALELFDQLGDRLGLEPADRELLESGALLANVGLFISHSGHHKHSYYVIRSSEHLMGYTDQEIELIAQVARYHRKGRPADKHPAFAALSAPDKARVRAMVCLLRVAIGMDRNHDGAVEHVVAQRHGRGHGDHVAAEQAELHARRALGHAVAHRGHATGHLGRGAELARLVADLVRDASPRLLGGQRAGHGVTPAGENPRVHRARSLAVSGALQRPGEQVPPQPA